VIGQLGNSAANQFSCYFTVPNDAFQVQATCLLIGADLLIGDCSHMPVFYCLTASDPPDVITDNEHDRI
jgi:hypothetical protein